MKVGTTIWRKEYDAFITRCLHEQEGDRRVFLLRLVRAHSCRSQYLAPNELLEFCFVLLLLSHVQNSVLVCIGPFLS